MKTIVLSTGIVAVLALASCNTVGGVGRDVQKVGDGIEKAADKTSSTIDEATKTN